MNLDKLIVEGMSEGALRRVLRQIDVPANEIAEYRTLKLLDVLVRLATEARKSALALSGDGKLLWERIAEMKVSDGESPSRLFALHDLRNLSGHKIDKRDDRLSKALARFSITTARASAGFGEILDEIYDSLAADIVSIASIIETAR